MWETKKAEHERKKQEFAAQCPPMAKAGPPPLLRDIVIGDNTSKSAVPLSGAEIMQNSQKQRGKQPCVSIDSLIGEAIDYNDNTASEEESRFWSAHDKSD